MKDAYRVSMMLLTQQNLSPQEIPLSYAEIFNYTYNDGDVCMLNQLNKISFPNEYSERMVDNLVKYLLKVNPNDNAFSELDAIEEIPMATALEYIERDYAQEFAEYEDFAEAGLDSKRLSTFFKRVISTVYTPGVTALEEDPTPENGYLATKTDDNAKEVVQFKGAFFDGDDRFEFTIDKKGSKWSISYKPDSSTVQKLEKEQVGG